MSASWAHIFFVFSLLKGIMAVVFLLKPSFLLSMCLPNPVQRIAGDKFVI